jgi:hypothetical protein
VYIADEDSASDISLECDDDSGNDTDALVEVCHLSKESIGKAVPSEWLADTGASSHMSDQPLLYRNFERINRRIIEVGGGVMYCNHYLFIYFISFNVIQPMWLCRQILTHKIADMSERRKQANKQKKTKQHT